MESTQKQYEFNISSSLLKDKKQDSSDIRKERFDSKEDIFIKPDDFQLKYRLHKKFDFKRRMNSSMDQASKKWARLEYNQSTDQVASASSSTCSPSQIDNSSKNCSSYLENNHSFNITSFKNTTNNDNEVESTANQSAFLSSSSDVLYEYKPSGSVKQEEVSSAGPVGGTKAHSKKNKVQASCQVCDDVAAGFYCGAYICEACKKFFIRASKMESQKYVCLRQKNCAITKETRVQCQYCRFVKCLSLNMYYTNGKKANKKDVSAIPCKVCSAPSSGYHFGAMTCEGCKGFFRRMAKEREADSYKCDKGDTCDVNVQNRSMCKSCRYNKCLLNGMSVDGCRIGRQPNAIKHAIAVEARKQEAKLLENSVVPLDFSLQNTDQSLDSLISDKTIGKLENKITNQPLSYDRENSNHSFYMSYDIAVTDKRMPITSVQNSFSDSLDSCSETKETSHQQCINAESFSSPYEKKESKGKSTDLSGSNRIEPQYSSSFQAINERTSPRSPERLSQHSPCEEKPVIGHSEPLPSISQSSAHNEASPKQNNIFYLRANFERQTFGLNNKASTSQPLDGVPETIEAEYRHFSDQKTYDSDYRDMAQKGISKTKYREIPYKQVSRTEFKDKTQKLTSGDEFRLSETTPRMEQPVQTSPVCMGMSLSANNMLETIKSEPSSMLTEYQSCAMAREILHQPRLESTIDVIGNISLNPSVSYNYPTDGVNKHLIHKSSILHKALIKPLHGMSQGPTNFLHSNKDYEHSLTSNDRGFPTNEITYAPCEQITSYNQSCSSQTQHIPHDNFGSFQAESQHLYAKESVKTSIEHPQNVSVCYNEPKAYTNESIKSKQTVNQPENATSSIKKVISWRDLKVDDIHQSVVIAAAELCKIPQTERSKSDEWDPEQYKDILTAWATGMKFFEFHTKCVVKFSKKIVGFRALELSDQTAMIKFSAYGMVQLVLTRDYNAETGWYNYFNLCKGEQARMDDLLPELQKVVHSHAQKACKFAYTLQVTEIEYCYLSCLFMLNDETPDLICPSDVTKLRELYMMAFKKHESESSPFGTVRFGELLLHLSDFYKYTMEHIKALVDMFQKHPYLAQTELFHEMFGKKHLTDFNQS